MKQEQVAELLSVSVEGMDYLVRQEGVRDGAAADILAMLHRIAERVEEETNGAEGLFRQIHLYAKNIQASLEDLNRNPNLYGRVVGMELRPFVLEMQRLWELGTLVLPSEESRVAHRAHIMEAAVSLHHAPPQNYRYDVSILLLAYNKLEYTRCALESILTHTNFARGNIELILLNNGSDDGTREYFEGVQCPHKRVVNLRHNILGTCTYIHVMQGKYFVVFSNDVVATSHWLDHLLVCMESGDGIGTAVPICNEESISNAQGIPVLYPNTFDGMTAMQSFAAEHNQMNPALWEERSQLMPFLHIVRGDLMRLCVADPVFTRAEFVDDDFSTLLRRTGWRQLLLKDTFMHHFGGVTLGEGRKKDAGNALDAMRRVYYEKWGVDAWDSRGGFMGVENAWRWHVFHENERVLILEPRFGDLACCLFNTYRRRGYTPRMTAAVFDERYLPDTGYLFDETVAVQHIEDIPPQGQYDIISAGCYLDELPLDDVIAALEHLYMLLAPGGMLLLPVRNPTGSYELDHLIREGGRDVYVGMGEVKPYVSISPRQLFAVLQGHSFLKNYRLHCISFESDLSLAEELKPVLQNGMQTSSEVEWSLPIRMLYLGIFCPEQGDGNLQQSGE